MEGKKEYQGKQLAVQYFINTFVFTTIICMKQKHLRHTLGLQVNKFPKKKKKALKNL